LIDVSSAGVLTYLHQDRIGSIIATTNSTGAVTNKGAYGPYGESAAAIAGTSFGYIGQRYDNETGLYYFNRRYYSPVIGRFLQPDPVGIEVPESCGCGCSETCSLPSETSKNQYQYALSNPLNMGDSKGLYSTGLGQGGGVDVAIGIGVAVALAPFDVVFIIVAGTIIGVGIGIGISNAGKGSDHPSYSNHISMGPDDKCGNLHDKTLDDCFARTRPRCAAERQKCYDEANDALAECVRNDARAGK
jgi:RHS repeat-associated protein